MRTLPPLGTAMPAAMLNTLVFTQPLGPTIDTNSPFFILQDVRSALDKTIGDWGCDVYGFSRMVKKKAPELVRGREDEWPARLRDCRFEVEVKADAAKAGGVAGGGIMQK